METISAVLTTIIMPTAPAEDVILVALSRIKPVAYLVPKKDNTAQLYIRLPKHNWILPFWLHICHAGQVDWRDIKVYIYTVITISKLV